jgi:hypothetical protein
MPSDRKQINVRIDPETEALIPRLIESVSAAIGLRVNQSDLFRLGLHELAKLHPPAEEAPPAPPTRSKRGRGRKA